jgi:hypothetical protein
MGRRGWSVALGLYALIGVVDGSARVVEARRATGAPVGPATVAVGFSAGLFWPLDLVGRLLFPAR